MYRYSIYDRLSIQSSICFDTLLVIFAYTNRTLFDLSCI
nr:MAG TPA: hypothetical protein [Caudoviricetes sp.]